MSLQKSTRSRLRLKVGIAVAVFAISLRPAWTPPLRGGLTSLEQIEVRGSRQWLLTRGKDRQKPVVLFLHGGPGLPLMPLAYRFERPLEEHFVVVQWDQRGSGKSYDGSSARIDQIVDDTIAVSEMLNKRFGKKIYIVGFSWGSYLGIVAAQKRPDLYAGFIGVGQVVTWDPLHHKRGEKLHGHGTSALTLSALLAPEYTWRDYWRYTAGFVNGAEARLELQGKTIQNLHPAVPMYFFQGRFDGVVEPELVETYANQTGSKLVWFENSAHWVFMEEQDKFVKELISAVNGAQPANARELVLR